MYYLFNDSGALIDEYESADLGLGAQSMFPESILLYSVNPKDQMEVWELGIEIKASHPRKLTFFYTFAHHMGGHVNRYNDSLEVAIENLKRDKEEYPKGIFYGDKIEERITREYEVKIP